MATTIATTALDEATIQAFRAGLRGELIRPDHPGYDEARKVFNTMIDKKPALIARCAGAADVISAVNVARTNHLLVAVRGGGHNITGNAVCDGGIVIDLSRMKGLRIDQAARSARAEPGLTWGELNHDLQAFGLGATGGYISTTGIAGLTLGGGLGWMVRKHGLACDNLLSVDVVTADGQFLTASATQNQDLFWGLRGGGGNFGVVTSFEFQVHPVGMVLAGLLIHPLPKAPEVLRFFREHVATVPDELTWGVLLFNVPPVPFLPPEAHGAPVVAIGLVYTGPLDTGEQVVRPLREFGPPLADLLQPMPYSAAQTMADILFPPGFQNYWKSNYLQDLSDDAIDTIVNHLASVPLPHNVVLVDHNGGGAISRVGADETAFPHREWTYNFLICSNATNAADAETNIRWTRGFWEAMQPFAAEAVYVNYLGSEGEDRVKAAYGSAQYERLVALKNKYDPTNLFRLNQNIKPSV
ncbi:MAG TPA: FAD-binding oxidoreductase [Chloroflexota bacterium]|nr:FAD-binding oxidoreductase [Chloroflexota bacterium]